MRIRETAPTRPEKRETLPQDYPHRLCVPSPQVGDNQGPSADDVGNDVDKMWHTQVVGQDGLFQSGTRGHPIASLSALQPIHNEFGHCEPFQTPEHTRRCPLSAPSKQPKIENWVIKEFLTIPTAQIFTEGFHKDIGAIAD